MREGGPVGTTPGPAARGRTPSRNIEQALVDAAETVLVRDGPAAVTVRAVAAEAGVAPMGIYSRFGGKDGLVQELLVRGFDGLRDALTSSTEADPAQRLRTSGVHYRQFALAHPAYYAVMFEGAIPHERTPATAEHAAAAFGALVNHVQTAMAAGRLAEGDAYDVSQQIWSTVHGAVSLELKGLVLTKDPEQTYYSLLDLLLRGLAAAPR
jgi:AcrR family transcriptional regulator